jgi:HPt (histidine-containing phosphotransfer) domain-containing protein
MPGMNGIEATEKIRQWEAAQDKKKTAGFSQGIPIIVLTANAIAGMREMFLEMGFNDYLSKPIDIAKLDEVIARWVPKEKQVEGLVERKVETGLQILIPGIDTQKGISLTGGYVQGYKQVLSQFCRDLEKRLPYFDKIPFGKGEQLTGDLTGDFAIHLAIHAHAIKSAAATIGADELSQAAAELEAAGKAWEVEKIRSRLPGFCADLKETLGNIQKMLNESGDGAGETGTENQEELHAAFSTLKTALDAKDMETIDIMLEKIKGSATNVETKQKILDIEDTILLSKFKAASEKIDELFDPANPAAPLRG